MLGNSGWRGLRRSRRRSHRRAKGRARDHRAARRRRVDPRSREIVAAVDAAIAEAWASGTALIGDTSNTLVTFAPLARSPLAAVVFSRNSVFVDQGLFFSGAAVVTFGGAYAVLAYVAQQAVHVYGWLAPGEMVRGLALAETTPGPLIMVVQFVAFVGAYREPGALDPWVAAVLASFLVTWVTFVPCFLFIFLGAPYVKRLEFVTSADSLVDLKLGNLDAASPSNDEVVTDAMLDTVAGYARLEGRVIGVVANQPRQRGGVLFVDSADKAARFIWTCNAFNVPLLFLADVPGFMIGTQVERQGIIRAGAKMISAVSEATVPKLSVIVRKAYGAGLYAMAGPAFDPDACIALPNAKIAVMGPQAAINAVFYNQLQAIEDDEERARRTEELVADE